MDDTKEWQEYQKGLDYKRRINLQAEVDKNERFYSGRQWEGVKSNGLPTPVFNIMKRAIQYKIAAIMSNQVKMQYSVEGIDDEVQDDRSASMRDISSKLSDYSETMWERLKQDKLNEEGLKDASLSGDMISYHFWDDSIDTGQEAKGDVNEELVDNINYIPGNPNDNRVQTQPYNIIVFRKMVSDIKAEAKANGIAPDEIEKITADTETENQSGDMSKIELDNSGKVICLLKLWKNPDTGTVWAKKSTRGVVYRKEYDTGLKRYNIAMMNWETRKNSCHGVPEGSALIDNQIFINKGFAMAMVSAMLTAFPKFIYDSTRIHNVTNTIGESIAVDGETNNAAGFLTPGQASVDIYKMIDMAIQYTKEMMGANEAALGEVDPKNTSAIIAVQKASSIPLESIKRRFYQYIEDIGLIWLDFWTAKYAKRGLTIKKNGVTKLVQFDGQILKDVAFRLKVDVGPSSQWSEITALQTLDNLLTQEKISFLQYLERLPNGIIPMKQELIDEIKQMEQNPPPAPPQDKLNVSISYKDLPPAGQIQAAAQAGIQLQPNDIMSVNPEIPPNNSEPPQLEQLIRHLPPEVQQKVLNLPPEIQQMAIQELMGGGTNGQEVNG